MWNLCEEDIDPGSLAGAEPTLILAEYDGPTIYEFDDGQGLAHLAYHLEDTIDGQLFVAVPLADEISKKRLYKGLLPLEEFLQSSEFGTLFRFAGSDLDKAMKVAIKMIPAERLPHPGVTFPRSASDLRLELNMTESKNVSIFYRTLSSFTEAFSKRVADFAHREPVLVPVATKAGSFKFEMTLADESVSVAAVKAAWSAFVEEPWVSAEADWVELLAALVEGKVGLQARLFLQTSETKQAEEADLGPTLDLKKSQSDSGCVGPTMWFSLRCHCGSHDEFLSYGEALRDWNQRQLAAWAERDAML